MGGSIASMLSDVGALRSQLASAPSRFGMGGASAPASESFATQLDESFRARAKQLGLELPAAAPASHLPGAPGNDVDEIWKRAQLESAAIHGPGDAMMQAFDEAADARWEQRFRRDGHDLFDM